MLRRCVALGTLEMNVVTVVVVVATANEGGVGKGKCVWVGRGGT